MDAAAGNGALDPVLLTALLAGNYQIYAVVHDGVAEPVTVFADTPVTVQGEIDLSLTATQAETSLVAGQKGTIDVVLRNDGTRDALNVSLQSEIEGDADLVAIFHDGVWTNPETFEIDRLAAGQSVTLRLQVAAGTTPGQVSLSLTPRGPNAELNLANNLSVVAFTLRQPFHRIEGTKASGDFAISDINGVILAGGGKDTATGAAGDDLIYGAGGADSLQGGDGNDYLSGGLGNDEIRGGRGRDDLRGGSGADTLRGGDGGDLLAGGADDDLLLGGDCADTLDGGQGQDLVSYADAAAGIVLNLANAAKNAGDAAGDVFAGIEAFEGSAHGDVLTGDGQANHLSGLAGNDTLNGGNGKDTLLGGNGADRLNGGVGADHVVGGKGRDTAILGQGDDLYVDDAEGLKAGRDTVSGGKGNDTIEGGGGNDVFRGDNGFDRILGGAGNDKLYGGNQADVLNGGNGQDTLFGGAGRDKLTGGGGADVFVFADGFGQDTVFGFSANDKEDLNLKGVSAITDFQDLLDNHLVDQGGLAKIVVGTNSILLKGVAFADVGTGLAYSEADFVF